MSDYWTTFFMSAVVCALLLPLLPSQATAQRGGQHLNSPGYQRALIESRKPKPMVEPTMTAPVKKKRPRRARVHP